MPGPRVLQLGSPTPNVKILLEFDPFLCEDQRCANNMFWVPGGGQGPYPTQLFLLCSLLLRRALIGRWLGKILLIGGQYGTIDSLVARCGTAMAFSAITETLPRSLQ